MNSKFSMISSILMAMILTAINVWRPFYQI